MQGLDLIPLRVPVLIWLPDGPRGPVGGAVGREAADVASQSIIIFFFDGTDLKMTDEKQHILYSFDAHIEITL